MKNIYKRTVAAAIILSFVAISFLPVFSPKAEALFGVGDVVFDPLTEFNTGVTAANTTMTGPVKEFGLDAIAWMLANLIIQRMSASTVNWINGGFQGSPAFITNPESFFGNIGDQVAGQFIFNNPDLNFLCGPIAAKIKISLARSYVGDNSRYQCTLTQVGANMENFMSDFQNGGWDNFFEISQRQQNNPIGAYIQAQGEMEQKLAEKVNTATNELNQGNGFMSWKKCPDGGDTCDDSEKITQTPGSVIQAQLNETLSSGSKKLEVADELNEIVSSLLSQLIGQVMGGVGGLLGAGGGSGSTGPSLTSQMLESTANGTTDVFGNKQNTTPPTVTPPETDYFGNTIGSLSSSSGSATNRTPVGAVDNADCAVVIGWTCDPDDFSKPLSVHFYYNGPSGSGTFIGTATAGTSTDVATLNIAHACNGNPNHRFSFPVPTLLKDGLQHSIYSYTVDTPSNNEVQLSASPKSITCPANGSSGGSNSSSFDVFALQNIWNYYSPMSGDPTQYPNINSSNDNGDGTVTLVFSGGVQLMQSTLDNNTFWTNVCNLATQTSASTGDSSHMEGACP